MAECDPVGVKPERLTCKYRAVNHCSRRAIRMHPVSLVSPWQRHRASVQAPAEPAESYMPVSGHRLISHHAHLISPQPSHATAGGVTASTGTCGGD